MLRFTVECLVVSSDGRKAVFWPGVKFLAAVSQVDVPRRGAAGSAHVVSHMSLLVTDYLGELAGIIPRWLCMSLSVGGR